MADAELGVLLEPLNDADDLENEIGTVNVATEPEKRGGAQTGGGGQGLFGRGTAVAAILAAILSQVRSVAQFGSGLLKTVSKFLVPLIAGLVNIIRPAIDAILNRIAELNLSEVLENTIGNLTDKIQSLVNGIREFLGLGQNKSADTTNIPGSQASVQNLQDGVSEQQAADIAGNPVNSLTSFTLSSMTTAFVDQIEKIGTENADRQDEEKKSNTGSGIEEIIKEIVE
jgi:hypothetical protein